MVKNLPSNAGDMSSIPGQGTKISRAVWQLSLSVTTREKLAYSLFTVLNCPDLSLILASPSFPSVRVITLQPCQIHTD